MSEYDFYEERRCREPSSIRASIADVIRRNPKLKRGITQSEAQEAWMSICNEYARRWTGKVFLKERTLCVQILSAPLRANLMMDRARLILRVNQEAKRTIIDDIFFF